MSENRIYGVVRPFPLDERNKSIAYLAGDVNSFEWDEQVVIIPASVYEFLKQTEALVANGVVLDVDEYKRLLALDKPATPRKRCMNCDGNNVNAPCTCEGV